MNVNTIKFFKEKNLKKNLKLSCDTSIVGVQLASVPVSRSLAQALRIRGLLPASPRTPPAPHDLKLGQAPLLRGTENLL